MSDDQPSFDLRTWSARLRDTQVDKGVMDRLVLDYLMIEGHKDAAAAFAREAGLEPEIDLESLSDRMSLREKIQNGDVRGAVERVNTIDPTILEQNKALAFRLRQQELIEIIRAGRVDEALAYAQEQLAPAGGEDPAFLEELERTMALLAFEDGHASPVGHLLDSSQRQKTASELNSAILAKQSRQTEPKLPTVLRMLLWTQDALSERARGFPRISNLTDFELESGSPLPSDEEEGEEEPPSPRPRGRLGSA